MSRPGIEPGPPRWDVITLEKSHSNSSVTAIRNIYCTYDRATSGEFSRNLGKSDSLCKNVVGHKCCYFCVHNRISDFLPSSSINWETQLIICILKQRPYLNARSKQIGFVVATELWPFLSYCLNSCSCLPYLLFCRFNGQYDSFI